MESPFTIQLALSFEKKGKLLIVEDSADARRAIAAYFSTQGYEVLEASKGKDALDTIRRNRDVDVVLLDLFIPEIGGLELLTEIQICPERPGVILLTGLADREVAHDALRLGAFDYILKPVNLHELESSVVACLAHREYLKQSWWKRLSLKSTS